MPSPMDKLRGRRGNGTDATVPPEIEFKPDFKPPSRRPTVMPAADDTAALPEHARPLPSDHGPQPLPGRDSVEEPTDGE